MIHNNKVLGIIPARGGSKGLPGKNLKNLGGKPLIAWSIEEVKKSKYIDRCIVSTDDEGIAQVLFLGGDGSCETSYADKKGKYQAQKDITVAKVDGG